MLQQKILIGEDETAGELHDKLMVAGAELVLQTVKAIENNNIDPKPQPQNTEIKHAPKIFKDDCKINWQLSLEEIHNHIRGLSPYPAAWTILNGKVFKIYRTQKEENAHIYTTGKILSDGKTYAKVAVKGGFLHLIEIQQEGKKRLPVTEFLKGFKIEDAVLA